MDIITHAPNISTSVITSDNIEAETIKLIYCPTDEMTADTLTKALPNMKAKNFATALGLCTV
jgi:hypothetical protein